jgi:tetratricopeptide (TPR) repeat protein
LLVGALASTGKVEEAGLRAADAVALFPGDHSLKFQYGSLLLATDKERGWQLRREAYQASPEVLQQVRDVLRTPGMREKVLNDFAAEAPELEALLASLPTDRLAEWYVLFSRATLEGAALNQPNYRRLIEAFEFLLADFPGSVDLRIFLAEFQDAAGDPSRALTVLQQGLPAPEPGGEDRLHLELARRFWDANDAERTVDHLSAVRRQLEPGAQRILATALEQTGRWREAVDAYDRALELGEDPNPERLLRFAFLNICLERDERGAALLEKSAAVAPDSADLHLYRSEVLYRLERYEEARAESEESLSLQPGEPTAAARLSRVLTALNRADEAAVKRDLALTLMPAATAYNQACALALLGMRNESLERLASALQEDPKLSDWAQVDADLRDLRDSPEFQQLFAAELRTAAG